MSQPDETELPTDLARLASLAAAADAQIAGADAPPGAPTAEEAAAADAADEHQSVAGFLKLGIMVASKACPPLAKTYDTASCEAIAAEYLRCADAYGWTFHRQAGSPIVGLCAAIALPAVMHAEEFGTWIAERKRAKLQPGQPQQPPSSSEPPTHRLVPINPHSDPRPHAGQRVV